jgi:hypothetical protein
LQLSQGDPDPIGLRGEAHDLLFTP